MNRVRRGWALTKQSWAIVQGDRSLIAFPIISVIAAVLTAAVFFGAGIGLISASDADWVGIPFLVAGLYLVIAIGIFFSVALSACAAKALEGQDTTTSEGIAAARSRLGLILQWAAVQLVVGSIIAVLEALLKQGAGQLIGAIVGGLANVAWAIATYFAIPVIALEGLGPKDALKRSAGVVKQHWGESVVGAGAIGIVFMLVGILPAAILIGIGIAVLKSAAAVGGVLIGIGVIVFVITLLLQSTVAAVFKVVLFRYATDGAVLGGFDQQQLESAFRPKKRSGR